MEFVKKNALGILICLVIAVPAWLLGQRFEVVGGPVFAILIGMVIALFWKDQKSAKSGTTYTSKKILQLAVVLLGFGMNLSSVLQVGGQSLPIIVSTIATSLIVAFALYKALHMDSNISTLIGVGSSICGGSAIAAVAPVIDADENQTSLSLATIFILNAVALFVFPVIGHWLGMGQTQFGTWAAIAIHDTSSVVGAGAAYGEEALKVATTVKLTRALWIIPLSLVSALIFRQKGKKIQIPWFIFWFVVAMLVNTYCNLPTQLTHGISVAARCGLSATLFLIGGGLSIEVIRKVGLKPLVLGIILWAVISVASLAVILLL